MLVLMILVLRMVNSTAAIAGGGGAENALVCGGGRRCVGIGRCTSRWKEAFVAGVVAVVVGIRWKGIRSLLGGIG